MRYRSVLNVAPKLFGALFISLATSAVAPAAVTLPQIFSDHMVLQRGIGVPVWGHADPGEQITVTFAGRSRTTTAGANGKWRVTLERMTANATPQTLTVKGRNTVTFVDVLVGDVWLCSGQSNMGLYLGETHNAAIDVPAARDSLLRLFRTMERTSITPEDDVALWNGKKWLVCAPDDAKSFTAVGYFFGRELRKDLSIPIGLINSSQGGSKAQLWTSLEAIEDNLDAAPEFKQWLDQRKPVVEAYPQRLAEYRQAQTDFEQETRRYRDEVENAPEFLARMKAWEAAKAKALAEGKALPPRPQPSQPRPKAPEPPDGGPHNAFMVGNLYNAMISPLIPYGIKGVIWYQGESNDGGRVYRALFPILITDWREKWGQGDFPFLFVQLPNINKLATDPVQSKDRWPAIRDAQAATLHLPNTGMATAIDVGDPDNVHSKDKVDVGVRLSLVARHLVYGENIVWTGPVYNSMTIGGKSITITFSSVGSGLVIGVPPWTPSGVIPPVSSKLNGFAIAGPDRRWFAASARIDGNRVVVSSDQVPQPVAVRYGWADNPACNLYNKEKLPAAPFRTDDWEP